MSNPFKTITDAIAVMGLFGADPLETRKTVQGATYPFPWGSLKKEEDPDDDDDYNWQEEVLSITIKKIYDPEVDYELDVFMTEKGFNMLTRLMKVAHMIKIDREFVLSGYTLYAVELDKNFKITALRYEETEATQE